MFIILKIEASQSFKNAEIQNIYNSNEVIRI